MNKSKIQKFAMWARNELIAQVSQRAYQYGIDESGFGDASADTLNGRLLTAEEKSQRQELIRLVKKKGYNQVMEEVAYTWFNRFIALRFMEVNNYLPSHIRVFSDASGAFKPEILRDALHLELPGLNHAKVAEYIENSETEALYRYLLLTQCNALNSALPMMFERMGGYTEMLLPNNILRPDSVLARLIADIDEQDWTDQVQIIGWLYQYYNTELKDDTFAQLKKNVKITKERIPAATQLFTPDWIVRYMVENSLGRLWLEGHPNAELRDSWKYYLDEAEQEPEVEAQLTKLREEYKTIKPEEIKVIDPCMGSGHILVYAFDVLMQIYTSAGWDQREAAQSILKNNLFGLDIDDRAAQLAYFAVMMKARQYDRRLLTRGIQPNIYSICESNGISADVIAYFHGDNAKLKSDIESIVTELHDAKEYGSILNITPVDFAGLYARFDEIRNDISMMKQAALDELLPLVQCAELLAQKYDVVVTNPPYMGSSGMNALLADYVKTKYPDSKSDLFACFIERCGQMAKKNGYQAMITQHAWMFLSSFEKLRTRLLAVDIVNMAHLGARAFEEIGGEVVQTTSFVIRKSHITDYKGEYCRLIEPTTQQGKEDMFLAGENRYEADQSNFSKIPGSPVAYWVSEKMLLPYATAVKLLGDIAAPCAGLATGDNTIFQRNWFEISFPNIGFNVSCVEETLHRTEKWYPCNSGGDFRKWSTDDIIVVNWQNDGAEIKQFRNAAGKLAARPQNTKWYFKEGLTWNKLSSSRFAVKYKCSGYVFDDTSRSAFPNNPYYLKYIIGLLCSNITFEYLKVLNPTMSFTNGDLIRIPVRFEEQQDVQISELVERNIALSKTDWDSYETSWDFKRNPLI